MKDIWIRRVIIISIIIVIFWVIGLLLKLAGWILSLLLPVAAIILIVAIIVSWYKPQHTAKYDKKEPIRIARDTSDKKK